MPDADGWTVGDELDIDGNPQGIGTLRTREAVATHDRIDGLPDLVRPLCHNHRSGSIDAARDAAWVILTVLSRGDW